MVLVARYLLRLPDTDALYNRIAAATADGSIDSKIEAERDIGKFLTYFGNDSRAEKLRGYENDIRQQRFELRFQGLSGAERLPPVEQACVEALNYARLDPELGMAKLQAIVDLYCERGNDAGPTARCLVLARRRLAELRDKLAKQAADELGGDRRTPRRGRRPAAAVRRSRPRRCIEPSWSYMPASPGPPPPSAGHEGDRRDEPEGRSPISKHLR